MGIETPIFRSAHEALRFAFSFNHAQYQPSPLKRLLCGYSSDRGLFGLEGAATAANIKRVIDTLPAVQRSSIICRYTEHKEEFERAAPDLLMVAASALPTGLHKRIFVMALIHGYFGRATLRNAVLRDEFGLSHATLGRRRRDVARKLREMERVAGDQAEGRLLEARVID